MYRRQISRFGELYNPTVLNFQIWLALLAFTLFIFTTLFDFKDGRWHMLDRLIADFPSIWHGVVIFMAVVLVMFAVFVFVNLIIITIKAFIRQKQEDAMTVKQRSLEDLSKQVEDLKTLRGMIDKTLEKIGDKEDKEQS